MEMLSAFKFPSGKESKPLQTLSPERVNASRPLSTISTETSRTSNSESQDMYASPQSSPTRRAKANLFADYNPTSGTPKVSGFALPQSPSLPEIHAFRTHVRTNSDVQGLVKRFEHLDVRDREAENAERRKKHEAELQRAQVAREEAESEAQRFREQVRRLEKELDEERERERKVAKRLEVVMEDFGASKQSHSSQASVYEKEVRKARKEAFKSSSAVLKLQEELKSTRNTLRVTQSGFDLEKQKGQRKEQERFEMEYQLIPLQEQVEKLTQRLKVVESEKEAFKTAWKADELARIAATLPSSQDADDDLMNSPRKPSPTKRAPSPLSDDKENMPAMPKKELESKRLAEELERETIRREHAEEMAEFFQMECRFRCCECRTVAKLGHDFASSLDAELAAGVEKIRESMVGIQTPPASPHDEHAMEVDRSEAEGGAVEEAAEVETDLYHTALTNTLDRSVTMTAESPKAYLSPDEQLHEEEQGVLQDASPTPAQAVRKPSSTEATHLIPLQPSTPPPSHHAIEATPFRQQPSIRNVTTTTTIPMQFTPGPNPKAFTNLDPDDAENIPPTNSSCAIAEDGSAPTFDRAAALAAIEYRRGRAKSIADGHATPRKQMVEGVKERRDISAPALGQKSGGVNGASGKAPGSVGRAAGKKV